MAKYRVVKLECGKYAAQRRFLFFFWLFICDIYSWIGKGCIVRYCLHDTQDQAQGFIDIWIQRKLREKSLKHDKLSIKITGVL